MEKQSTRKFLKLIVALVALFLLASSALLFASCKEEHEHVLDEGKVTTSATCTTPGVMTFYCTVEGCSYSETKEIEPSGHDYQLNADQSYDATCTSEGSKVYVCSRCNDSYAVTSPATGHKWDEGKVTTEPTCQPGVKTYTCQNCGETKTESIAATTGHEWVLNEELTVAPTCAKDGVKFYECANCGATQEIVDPATGNHEYVYTEIAASCEENKIVTTTCKNCNYKVEEEVPGTLLGHNYALNTEDPDYLAPTCTETGWGVYECTRCDDRYTARIAALSTTGHLWAANTNVDDTLPGFPAGANETVASLKLAGWTTVTAQDCETGGVYQRVCTREGCGYSETRNSLATGHQPKGYAVWYAEKFKLPENATEKAAFDALPYSQKLITFFRDNYDTPYGVCLAQPGLTDVDDNEYAFECENPNCPCEVVVNSYGETANLVPAVAHTWTNANGTEIAWLPVGEGATCTEDGEESRTCPVCGFVDKRDVEALDHAWNTMQLDGRTEALVCSPDAYLNISNANGMKALIAVIDDYYKDDAYAAGEVIATIQGTLDKNKTTVYARFCFRCGELEVAKEHDYVVSKLTNPLNLNSYEKNEDGSVKVAEGIDKDDPTSFTCEYVLVCQNCGNPDHAGAHGEYNVATCREGSECPICHRPGDGQLKHQYVTMSDILNEKVAGVEGGYADSDKVEINKMVIKYNGKDVTYGMLRDAYEKLKGDESWMTPVEATCTTAGTEVYICYTCLLDAAAGTEFEWTTDTTEKAPENGYEYSAYTQATSDGHDWVAVYYKTDATDPMVDTAIDRELTSCESGFKVAYFCENCDKLFIKNLVVDDKDTAADETDANTLGANEPAYTNEKGFVINPNAYTNSADGFVATIKDNQNITEQNIKDILAYVDDHRGQHVVFIPANYKELAGQYVAPTCVDEAKLPVVCINCGAQLSYTYDRIDAQLTENDTDEKFTFAIQAQVETYLDIDTGKLNDNGIDAYVIDDNVFKQDADGVSEGALAAEARVNPNNHANEAFACGDHCNAYVLDKDGTTRLYCSGFDTKTDDQYWHAAVVKAKEADLNSNNHTTVNVYFQLSSRLDESYLTGYVLNIAVVEPDDFKADKSIDWSKVEFKTSDKIAKCSGGTNTAQYYLPKLYPVGGLTKGGITETTNYFVLLKDGVPYPITIQYNVYNEDPETTFSNDVKATMVYGKWGDDESLLANAYVTAPQGDNYFVDFGYGNTTSDVTRPGVPTDAEDSKSLLLAAQNPVITTTKTRTVYTINFVDAAADAEPMNWTLAADGSNLYSFYTAISKYGSAEKPAEVVVDLGGNTVVLNMTTAMLFNNAMFGNNVAKITFANGAFNLTSLKSENYAFSFDFDDATSYAREFVFDNFDILSTANAVTLAADMTGSVSFVNGSTVTAYGTYGIFVDDADASSEPTGGRSTILTIDGSTVTVTMNPATLQTDPYANWALSTALFVGAPVAVEVRDGSVLSAAGQAVVVRMGTLSMANTRLVLVAGYEDDDLATAGITTNTDLGITSAGYGGDKLGYVASRPLQMYRQYGVWGKLNNVVRAALVIGNSYDCDLATGDQADTTKDYYDLPVYVTLNNITFDNSVEDAQNIAIAARYHATKPEAAETTMVTVKWTGNTQLLKNSVMPNAIASLITINDDNLGA